MNGAELVFTQVVVGSYAKGSGLGFFLCVEWFFFFWLLFLFTGENHLATTGSHLVSQSQGQVLKTLCTSLFQIHLLLLRTSKFFFLRTFFYSDLLLHSSGSFVS